MRTVQDILDEDMKQSFNKAVRQVFDDAYRDMMPKRDYYPKRKHGKYTIYNKDGMRVAWGLNEKEMKAYMKLLKEEK
jgi:hypothetical protein